MDWRGNRSSMSTGQNFFHHKRIYSFHCVSNDLDIHNFFSLVKFLIKQRKILFANKMERKKKPQNVKRKKKPQNEVLSEISTKIKENDLAFIEDLVDAATAKEKKRFKRFRLPIKKYIERLPIQNQYEIRLAPKKPPAATIISPPKKKNWSKLLDQQIDLLIERISILKDIASTQSIQVKKSTIVFLKGIKDQIKDFEKDLI